MRFRSTYIAPLVSLLLFVAACDPNDGPDVPGEKGQITMAVTQPTTLLLVRHADRVDGADALTAAGHQRARVLADVAAGLRVGTIYVTDTARSRQTAAPTAERLGVPPREYPPMPPATWFETRLSEHAGGTVLVVGHSNTLERLVAGFGGSGLGDIRDDEYDRLYVLSATAAGATTVPLRVGAEAAL